MCGANKLRKHIFFRRKNNSSKWVYRGGLIHVHVKTYICHICACHIREGKLWYQNVCSPADALELNTILQHNMKFISNVYALFGLAAPHCLNSILLRPTARTSRKFLHHMNLIAESICFHNITSLGFL